MNILTLNYEFPPLGGGGGVVCRDLAAQLMALGHGGNLTAIDFKESNNPPCRTRGKV